MEGPNANKKGTHQYLPAPLDFVRYRSFDPTVEGSNPSGPTNPSVAACSLYLIVRCRRPRLESPNLL